MTPGRRCSRPAAIEQGRLVRERRERIGKTKRGFAKSTRERGGERWRPKAEDDACGVCCIAAGASTAAAFSSPLCADKSPLAEFVYHDGLITIEHADDRWMTKVAVMASAVNVSADGGATRGRTSPCRPARTADQLDAACWVQSIVRYAADEDGSVRDRVRSCRVRQGQPQAGQPRQRICRQPSSGGRDGGQDPERFASRLRTLCAKQLAQFYQQRTDIYATAVDYDVTAQATKRFFAMVQNKLHWAIHGQTAAEVIVDRADANKEHMGLRSRKRRIRREQTGTRRRASQCVIAGSRINC
jgi:hypothetical protein